MGGSKKLKFVEDEEINFNDSKSFEKIVSQISKGKSGSFSFKDVPKKIIGFLTSNVKSVAIIAGYILLCGIGLNIYWISKINILYTIGFLIIIFVSIKIYKNSKKLSGLKNFFNKFKNKK